MLAARIFLRRRMDLGVASTNSSSRMNSMACSRFKMRGETRRIASSAVEERMFVSFFSLTIFTSGSVIDHFRHLALASAQLLDHDTEKGIGTIDDQHFERLVKLTIDRLRQDFRLPHHQLIAFAPHAFDKDRKLKFAPPHYSERFR